ncbi:acyltransferase [Clostridium aciditolerans]|uniref:Acyltransferase n=1 Tax=Clostridium aciditolerans TaxID=339861 RepID=A0A934HX57_9CLOT|nr:acyltransferase [Clostridium aciditolerans]MBI6873649.1 acyltransferase [Clostridium aciditolerans]
MLKRIDKNNISTLDLISILSSTLLKIIRGFLAKAFFAKSDGLIFIGKRTKISNKNKIIIGKNMKFEMHCEVQGLSKRGLVFGDNVTIGNSTMIRPSSYYGVEVGEGLKMGNNSSIGPMGYIGCAGYISIGSNVMIGPRVSFFAENHNFNDTSSTIKSQGVIRKGIIVEDDCWIGSGVIVLDGVTIGRGSIIGAGTIVTKDIPPYSIVVDKREKIVKSRMEN